MQAAVEPANGEQAWEKPDAACRRVHGRLSAAGDAVLRPAKSGNTLQTMKDLHSSQTEPEPACSGTQPALAAGKWQRGLLVLVGLLFTGLAVAGAFLPLLPTTPFLLLAATCFARSSPRLHHWLHANPLFGDYLRRWRNGEGMPLRAKIVTLSLLWLSLSTSALLAVPEDLWPVRIALALTGVGVSVHILRIKTCRPPARS